ncbi:unnamed protein product, partial [Durusdinium trenchii]
SSRVSFDTASLMSERVDAEISKRYDIDMREIGIGGYGKVFLAKDRMFKDRQVAIKKVTKIDEERDSAFKKEVLIMKKLDHPNICRLFETYEQGRVMYFVIEFCEGGDLFDRYSNHGKLPETTVAPIIKQTATWDSDDAMDSDDSDLKELYGHNGVLLTAGIIAADVIGAGILAMPAAMANLGLYAGTAALIALLLANVHVSMVMWRVRMNCPTCVGATTYTALVQGAFAKAPAWQQEIMIHLTSFSQKSFLFGMMVLYLLSAGKGFGMIFHHVHVCLPNWMIYAAFLLFPFAASARHLGSWQSLVWINVVSLMGTVLIPLCFYALNGTEKIRVPGSHVEAVSELSPRQILSSLSTFFFGMTSQFMLLEIIAEMKDPMELPKAYAGYFAPFQLVMFSLAGIAGYWYMGNKVGGMMNENLPFGPSLQAAAGCMLVHMLISYLIKGVVVCKSIHRAVDKRYAHGSDTRPRSWMAS